MTSTDNAKSKAAKQVTSKIGELVDLAGKPFLMRLPDGTVVTARGTYAFRETGEHVAIVDGKETVIKVESA